jgi:quercetin dioxygenase-like cupin family protein
VKLVAFDAISPYEPAGHRGAVNRLLAGLGAGGVAEVSVWHGTIEPGGGSDEHVHERAIQVYVGLSGTLTVTGRAGSVTIGSGDAVILRPGERHAVTNATDDTGTLLVISAPALR